MSIRARSLAAILVALTLGLSACGNGDDDDGGGEDTGVQADTGQQMDTSDPMDTGEEQDTGEAADTDESEDTGPAEDTGGGDTADQGDTGGGDTGEPGDTTGGDTTVEMDTGGQSETGMDGGGTGGAEIYDLYDGSSYNDGDTVTFSGVVVTAVRDMTGDSMGSSGLFIQEPKGSPPEDGGVFVRLGESWTDSLPARGDLIDIEATVVVKYGLRHLRQVNTLTVNSSGNPLPDPVNVTADEVWTDASGTKNETLRGSLVRVQGVEVVNENPDSVSDEDHGEFSVWANGGNPPTCMQNQTSYACGLRIDDHVYKKGGSMDAPEPSKGDTYAYIQGPLFYSFDNTKVVPRDDQDLQK